MSQAFPIVINLFAAVIGAGGQYLYKTGASRMDVVPLYRNWRIAVGAMLFVAVMGLFIWGFKLGGRLSITYPMYATTFLWGTLLGIMVDKEPFAATQFAGVGLVVSGLALVAYAR